MFKNIVRPLFNGLIDVIYPRICLLCRSLITPSETKACLCLKCLKQLTYNHPVFCVKCSRPLKTNRHYFCKYCHRRPLHFDRCWSSLIYDDTMRYLVHLFKYGKNTGLRIDFSQFLINFIEKYNVPVYDCHLIIPIPIHPTRFRERGFNQSELIALLLAKYFQIPYSQNSIHRIRYTANQARVNPKQRWTNMQGTFIIKTNKNIINKNILLIDDVLTTGATLSEVALTLKKSGANKVYGLTVAIAI